MFQLAGLGEQAGSGLPRIYRNWREEHWRPPELQERLDPEQTLLTLRMVSLLPPETLTELDQRFGKRFRELPENARLAIATTAIEGTLTNDRMQEITSLHPTDITKLLTGLVREGFLEPKGARRGTYYVLPGCDSSDVTGVVFDEDGKSVRSSVNSQHNGANSQHSEESSQHKAETETYPPVVEEVRNKKRVAREKMEQAILAVCALGYLSGEDLAHILNRDSVALKNHYLTRLVREGRLALKFPQQPNHPGQQYSIPSERVP
jgi:predicted HTH transcriptional regulator